MLKTIKYLFLLLAIGTLSISCGGSRKALSTKDAKKLVELSKAACLRDCMVFDFTVYDNGVMTFEGISNTRREGLYYKKLTQEQLSDLKLFCQNTNLRRFNEIYRSRFPDAQTVTITYYDGRGRKRVTGKDERPEPVLALDDYLNNLAFSPEWTQAKVSEEKESKINNELIVKLSAGVDALAWSKKYTNLDLILKEALSEDKTFWKITFNPQKVSLAEIEEILRADNSVFSVQESIQLD